MNLLGSMLMPPPPDSGLALACGLLLLAVGGVGALGALQGKDALARRTGMVLAVAGLVGLLVGLAWAGATFREFRLAAGPGPSSLRGWVRVLDYPLHAAAAGLGCLLLAGTMALVLRAGARVGRWVPAAAVVGAGLLAFLPSLGDYDRDGRGFRAIAEDRLEREAKGEYYGNTGESLMATHPEIHPAARWRDSALALCAGTLVAAVFGLVRRPRTARGATAAFSLLAAASALLWGACSLLAVAQAVRWSSPGTATDLIESALTRASVPPFCVFWVAAALCVLALQIDRESRSGKADAGGALLQDPSP